MCFFHDGLAYVFGVGFFSGIARRCVGPFETVGTDPRRKRFVAMGMQQLVAGHRNY